MVAGNLDTTNLLLGILAAVSVIEALALVAAGVMGYRLYTRTLETVRELEQRQIAPLAANVNMLMAKVDGILTDVKEITARVTRQTERVDTAIENTVHRVDETADRVRSSVAAGVHQLSAFVHVARSVIESFFHGRASREASAT
jgi:methyl-accepting chemotaxis protein